MAQVETRGSAPEPESRPAESYIRRGVLAGLGSPKDLFGVRVLWLWEHNYRVNVLAGDDVTATRIVASYFVTADERGNILRSEPAITKRY